MGGNSTPVSSPMGGQSPQTNDTSPPCAGRADARSALAQFRTGCGISLNRDVQQARENDIVHRQKHYPQSEL